MSAQLRAELLKQRSTRGGLGLLAGMAALIWLAVVLHALGLPAHDLADRENQLTVLGRGQLLGALFAALLGALSVTTEYRHGTIRPTFVAMPRRRRVVAAKVWTSMLFGAGLGLVGCGLAAAVGTAGLSARGVDMRLDTGDYVLLVAGGAAGAALWAAIGVGLGAAVRAQAPTLVGLCAWLLFVEGLLVGDVAGITKIGRFGPGNAAAAISGQHPGTLLTPSAGLAVLVAYALAAAAAGVIATDRRDVV